MDYDIYTGWIGAFVDGRWRRVFISPGWVTLAPLDKPNEHIGIFREEDVSKAGPGQPVEYKAIGHSPHALVAGPVIEADILDRIAFVRFGRKRVDDNTGTPWIIEATSWVELKIARNLDDRDGIDPSWLRTALPKMPSRWHRTARSLANS